MGQSRHFLRLSAVFLIISILLQISVSAVDKPAADTSAADAAPTTDGGDLSADGAESSDNAGEAAPTTDADVATPDFSDPDADSQAPDGGGASAQTPDIPDTWAHDALAFCVENGILAGNENHDLMPEKPATRAQLAAMVTRLLAVGESADLSAFWDADPAGWYADACGKAVAAGLLTGTGGGKLEPNTYLTREQAFTILARAFGVAGGNADALSRFADGAAVAPWAKNSLAAMVDAGLVSGANGRLNPNGRITRQELAQVFFNALDAITDAPTFPAEGNVLYTGSEPIPAGTTVAGDLIVTSAADLTLTDLTVGGRLVIREAKSIAFSGVKADKIVLLKDTAVTAAGDMPAMQILGGNVTVQGGNFPDVTVESGFAVLDGGAQAKDFTLRTGSAVLRDASAETLTIAANLSPTYLTVNGKVGELILMGANASVNGAGHVRAVYSYAKTNPIGCSYDTLESRYDAGLTGVWLAAGATPAAKAGNATVTVSATVRGVDSRNTYGVDGGIRKCSAVFTCDGKILKTIADFALTEGAALSCPVTVPITAGSPTSVTVWLTVRYGNQAASVSLPVTVTVNKDYLQEARSIRTIVVQATALRDLKVYKYASLSGATGRTIKKGEAVSYIRPGDASASCQIRLADWTYGWVDGSGLKISDAVYYADMDYSQNAKEYFVNVLNGYESPSKYLIWINLYTEHVNVFEGAKGNWKLIKSCRCSSGKNISPTRPGVYYIYSRAYKWTFDDNYYYVTYPSLFDGGIALHSRTYLTNGGGYLDSRLGKTITHGCVRIPDDMAKWVFDNCATNKTTVVVF